MKKQESENDDDRKSSYIVRNMIPIDVFTDFGYPASFNEVSCRNFKWFLKHMHIIYTKHLNSLVSYDILKESN